jgi:GAF domain-containing protein
MPYDAIAIYVRHGDELVPEYVNGDNFRLFASLRIPIGQGLSGWVAQNLKPILNGNPSVEPGYLNDSSKYSTLNSALAVPLEGLQGVVGVVALYHAEKDFFTSDHLRILLAVSSKMALAIENAKKYEQAESSAVTDFPHRSAECALVVLATRSGNGALQTRQQYADGDGRGFGRVQADQRPLRPPGRQPRAAFVCQLPEGNQP